jgi:hypothetical protein
MVQVCRPLSDTLFSAFLVSDAEFIRRRGGGVVTVLISEAPSVGQKATEVVTTNEDCVLL